MCASVCEKPDIDPNSELEKEVRDLEEKIADFEQELIDKEVNE